MSRRINKHWQGIIETLSMDRIPFDYVNNAAIRLNSGKLIPVQNETDLQNKIKHLSNIGHKNEEIAVEFNINFIKVKTTVDALVNETLEKVFKKQ